jgi:hypothetical protein
MNSNITIVSAFLSNMNDRLDYKTEQYINNGKELLKSKIHKIIFIDEIIFDIFKEYSNDYTYLIPIKKTDIYLYEYVDLLNNFELNTTSKSKDTIDYMFMMCSKTEWIKKAINLNIFNSINFIWVDFGIKHIFNCENELFQKQIELMNNKIYNKLRVGSIWNINDIHNIDIYKNIMWYFAGGVFGGDINSLLIFAEKNKNMCVKIISEKNTIMWEVNVWYLIYKENPELFDCYYCDHNSSLINNY